MAIDLDYLSPAQLTGYVRDVPTPATYTLNTWLPDVMIEDIEAAFDNLTRTNRAAKFRAWDAESPVGKRDQFERRRVALPPISQKLLLGEHERLLLERARSGGDNRSRLITAIYDDADTNVRAVRARAELARGDVLTDGKFTLVDENGLTLEADFGVDPSQLVTASTVWSDHTNSDPILDLHGWVDAYTLLVGEPPAFFLTNRTVVGHMVQNAKIRAAVSTLAGTPSIVTRPVLNQVLQANDLPTVVEYNTQIDVDGVATRPIPLNRGVLLPQDPRSLGITAWGITAEALDLVAGQNPSLAFEDAPGLVGVVMKDGDPVRLWTKVGGVVMPIITDSRRLWVATVLA
jgi:hypothetical protein